VSGFAGEGHERAEGRPEAKGHRRSNTIGEISGKLFGRSGSLFGRKSKRAEQQQGGDKQKRYPPISMNNSMPGGEDSRVSMDSKRSRRSFSNALGRKRSGSVSGSQTSQDRQSRRFSFIPGFSLKAIGIGKDYGPPPVDSQQDLPIQDPPQVDQYGRYVDQNVGREQPSTSTVEGMYTQLQDPAETDYRQTQQQQQQQRHAPQDYGGRQGAYNTQGAVLNTGSESSIDNNTTRRPPGSAPHQQPQYVDQQQQAYDQRRVMSTGRPNNRGVLQKTKRFVDGWDTDESSRPHDHSGSSGPARKVMDFFRRRGKARGGE
jgi:protein-serine/threonine kinase